jgi:hypothetical protein
MPRQRASSAQGVAKLAFWTGVFAVPVTVLVCPPAAHARDTLVGVEPWKARQSVSLQTLVGARMSWTSTSVTEGSYGGGISFNTAGYINAALLTMRGFGITSFGKGADGVEGYYAGDFALGVILPVGEGHGPFLRLGMRGYLFGNERVWLSNFEAPTGQLGYQYLDGPWLFEIAGRAGLVGAGRHSLWTGDELTDLNRRKLGMPSAAVGGHLALGYGFLRGEAEYTRTNVADAIGTPMHVWRLSLCVRKDWWGGCIDHQSWLADARMRDGTTPELAVGYGGLSIGIWTP